MKKIIKTKLMTKGKSGVRVKIYISGYMIGAGKMELLNLVHDSNSISKAASEMGMSYSRAKMLLDSIEISFKTQIFKIHYGNKGTRLTKFGKELLIKYLDLCKHLSKESESFIKWAKSYQ